MITAYSQPIISKPDCYVSNITYPNKTALVAAGALTLGAYCIFGPLGGLVASAIPAAIAYRHYTKTPEVLPAEPIPVAEPQIEIAPTCTQKPLSQYAWYSLIGLILFLFDRAIYVQDGEKTYYLKTNDLTHRVKIDLHPDIVKSSAKINRLALEAINPLVGRTIDRKKIDAFLDEFHASSLEDAEQALEKMKTRHLQTIPYDPKELEKQLKPGDILFRKIDDSDFNMVVFGQKVFQPFIRGVKERESYKYNHAAIYLGNGKIAEAVPGKNGDDVRIIHLSNSHFALADKNQYLISRPSDESLGAEAAIIAEKIAIPRVEGEEKSVHKYSKIEALLSAVSPSGFGPLSRRRYVENYYDIQANRLPSNLFGLRKFFCSYFATYCYQAAESQRVLPSMFGETDSTPKTVLGRREKSRYKYLTCWNEMSNKIKLKFDAARFTPQDFRNFIIRHPEQFKDVYLVKPLYSKA